MKQNNSKVPLSNCPSCGSNDFVHFISSKDYFFTQETFNLDKCSNCTLVFTNPVPPTKSLSSYYDSDKYLSHDANKKSTIDRIYRIIRKINIKRKYQVVKKYKNPSRVLEIGTGTGELLSYFKSQGWEETGIEPNEKARTFALEQNMLNVFDEVKLEQIAEGSFDLVMMWHVLEHVFDLNERMSQIKTLLKDDGIVIIAVPNIESPDFHYYQEFWAGLDVPRHLLHFSENSMDKLLNAHGISLIHSHPMKFDAYYVSLLSEQYKGNKSPYRAAFINGLLSNLKAKKQNNNYSSMIFVARKN